MSAERDPLDDFLSSIADGKSFDWEAVGGTAAPRDRARMEALGDVSRIAAFSRSLQQLDIRSSLAHEGFPERWGDLLLLERLAIGSLGGEVYRAWDTRLQREVALKLLPPGQAQNEESPFIQEARAGARIRHAHIVAVHGIDVHDGRAGLWMDLLRGPTLEQEIVRTGALDAGTAARLGMEIGSALSAVHEAGLLHRDVKPANIVRDGDRYVLTDFGLGKDAWHASPAERPSGTPMYMAPELFKGVGASPRSDVYGLGLTLWFALSGRHPFQAGSLEELILAVEKGPGPLPPGAPQHLVRVIEQATARRTEDRFPAANAFVTAMERAAVGQARRARVTRNILVGSLALALGTSLFLLSRRLREPVESVNVPSGAVNAPVTDAAAPGWAIYDIEATFLKHTEGGGVRIYDGDRVIPGDRLSLETKVSRPAWVYVLNEDERGEHYLLFPQPRFDLKNPVTPGTVHVLPGAIEGRENAWTVTSRGGREHLLVVVSPEPVEELEAELNRIPTAEPGRPVTYASVGPKSMETLRGVGGIEEIPNKTAAAAESRIFTRFKSLAGRESNVHGVWVRQVSFENP
ncbi:MAG TPA: serine/threonine-protein kinase [Candidatus Eisenbacteria bacterium]|nr:serine/threonine-protein kinase [Candidatus Eisenbacteria bacterium]